MTNFYFQQRDNTIEVRLASDEPVNAWQGTVLLPEDLSVERILTVGTISDIWQMSPRRQDDGIVFTGGRPGGFSGDGLLFKFTAESGRYITRFSQETAAYLHDGQGTPAETELTTLAVEPVTTEETILDAVRPQSFRPIILRDEQYFEGRPVAIFSTEDSGSGISRYEVREHTDAGIGDWQLAESPYLINEGVYKLEIKAVDNFGNERIEPLRVGGELEFAFILIAIVVVIVAAVVYNVRKRWRMS